MSIVIVADSTCDLPQKYWDNHNIEIFPFSLLIDGIKLKDTKDPVEQESFFDDDRNSKFHTADITSLSTQQVVNYFHENIVTKYDFALIVTASKDRSENYNNVLGASHEVIRSYRPFREAAGLKSNFALRVVNSGTLFSGLGILVAHMRDLIEAGANKKDLRDAAEEFKANIYTYCVPKDLYYLSTRAKSTGDKSVSVFAAIIAKLLGITPVILGHMDDTVPVARIKGYENAVNSVFDLACSQMRAGLKSPRVVVSYAGNLNHLDGFSGYRKLQRWANKMNVEVDTSVMSIVGGLILGPGTLTVGFACGPHDFK
ncbi:MAG: DegV family protein with EDD domain [Polaribacter sp.]|jgi:DegV family protein with EDD domain